MHASREHKKATGALVSASIDWAHALRELRNDYAVDSPQVRYIDASLSFMAEEAELLAAHYAAVLSRGDIIKTWSACKEHAKNNPGPPPKDLFQ